MNRREILAALGGAALTTVPAQAARALEPRRAVAGAVTTDDLMRIANGTEFGLTGALYSRDEDHLDEAVRSFHVGNLYLNRKCTGALVGAQPFGGFNMSGTCSKAGGPDYLGLFLQQKSVARRR